MSTATIRVASRTDNVAGVKLPVFQQVEIGTDKSENLGLASGGRKIGVCRDKFGEYLRALIKVASLQTSFVAMDEALKITNRRVNALENVTIPKIVKTINDINRELDELEREDFTRLKVVKRKKEEAIKIEEKAKELAKLLANALIEEPVPVAIASKAVASSPAEAVASNAPKDKKKKKAKKAAEVPDALAEFDDANDSDVVFR